MTKQIGFRKKCEHYLEFYIGEKTKNILFENSRVNANKICNLSGVCEIINLSENKKLMFVASNSRYYYDEETKSDFLLLNYKHCFFTTRSHIYNSSSIDVENKDPIAAIDEIVDFIFLIKRYVKNIKSKKVEFSKVEFSKMESSKVESEKVDLLKIESKNLESTKVESKNLESTKVEKCDNMMD